MSDQSLQNVEGVLVSAFVVGSVLLWLAVRLRRTRPGFAILGPLAAGFALRLLAIAGISATGLESALRGGDEETFISLARILAAQPIGHNYIPGSVDQLHTVLFALQLKLGFLDQAAMRITQVGFAMVGVLLIVASIHELAGPRAARLGAWLLALEPASLFFNSELHKDPLMELAAGLIVFGGTWLWKRLDLRGILICALGGLIGVETRSYAGWFLVAAAVLVLLHAAIRGIDRPLRAMPVIYAVVAAAFVVTPTLLTASSSKQLSVLQQSQNANATGAGESNTAGGGGNGSNLALEQVDFSTRGAILRNLPKRVTELLLEPYPWRLGDNSQRIGALGTLIAYVVLLALARYAWLSRRRVLALTAPLLYPFMFLTVAYALAVGNAGTGFRYRTHLITLAIGALVVLREHAHAARAEDGPDGLAGARRSSRPRAPLPAGV